MCTSWRWSRGFVSSCSSGTQPGRRGSGEDEPILWRLRDVSLTVWSLCSVGYLSVFICTRPTCTVLGLFIKTTNAILMLNIKEWLSCMQIYYLNKLPAVIPFTSELFINVCSQLWLCIHPVSLTIPVCSVHRDALCVVLKVETAFFFPLRIFNE